MNYEIEAFLYRIKADGTIELVDHVERGCRILIRSKIEEYLYDSPVGERYFATGALSGRLMGMWEVRQGDKILVTL